MLLILKVALGYDFYWSNTNLKVERGFDQKLRERFQLAKVENY